MNSINEFINNLVNKRNTFLEMVLRLGCPSHGDGPEQIEKQTDIQSVEIILWKCGCRSAFSNGWDRLIHSKKDYVFNMKAWLVCDKDGGKKFERRKNQ